MSTRMTQGVAEAGAAAVALQRPRVVIFMAALMEARLMEARLTEARLTGVTVGSAPEVASEVVVVMLAGRRDIAAGAVEFPHWRTTRKSGVRIESFPFGDFTNYHEC